MKKKWLHIVSASLIFCALVSCSKEEVEAPAVEFDFNITAEIVDMSEDATKAVLYNKAEEITDLNLKLYGWAGSSYWMKGNEVTYDKTSKNWLISDFSDKIKGGTSYSFLSYANMPSSGASITVPMKNDSCMVYTVTDIAKAQNDVLLGHGSKVPPFSDGNVELNFSHPYASVLLKVGNVSMMKEVIAVSLDGVYGQGKTTISDTTTKYYTWTDCGDPSATLTKDGVKKYEKDTIETFVVIPQNLEDNNVMVTVTYKDATDNTKTKKTIISSGKWTAGITTAYTINSITTIGITVGAEDNIIVNNGESKIYVRATITGAWYDSIGNVVAPWSDYDGIRTILGSDWTEDTSSHFFYYKNGIANGDSASSLFSSYSKPSAPVPGATLKLDVLVQAIPYDINKSCYEAFAALSE